MLDLRIARAKTNWEAVRAFYTGYFDVVFAERSDGVFIHLRKEVLEALLEKYPEVFASANTNRYEDDEVDNGDASVEIPNVTLRELLKKLDFDKNLVLKIND